MTIDQYTIAVIAVIGTLAGALLTGIISVVLAAVTARSQRRALSIQLDHASLENHRAERRQIYAEFVDCMERWNLLAIRVNSFSKGLDLSGFEADDDATVQWETSDLDPEDQIEAKKLEASADELWDRWRESMGRLQLISSPRVDDMAHQIFAMFVQDLYDAWNGEYKPENHSGTIHPVTLVAAMREDIGISESHPVDPLTGLRTDSPGEPAATRREP